MIYESDGTISYDENGNIIYNKNYINNVGTDSSSLYVLLSGSQMTGELKTPLLTTSVLSFTDSTNQTTAFTDTLKTTYDNYDTRITTNTNDIALLNTSVTSLQNSNTNSTTMANEIAEIENVLTYYRTTQTIDFIPLNTYYNN